MKYLRQLSIIFTISFLGQVLHTLIPAPIPASIYGLVLMLGALLGRIVRLEQVKAAGDFLISLMPLMFIGPSVQIMVAFSGHSGFLPAFLIITVVSLYVVMIVSGRVTQRLIRKSGSVPYDKEEKND